MIESKRKDRKGAKSNNVAREPARGEGARRREKKKTHLGGHCERLSLSARIKKVKGKERTRRRGGRKRKLKLSQLKRVEESNTIFSCRRERERDGERGIGRSEVGTQFVGRVSRNERAQSTATAGLMVTRPSLMRETGREEKLSGGGESGSELLLP